MTQARAGFLLAARATRLGFCVPASAPCLCACTHLAALFGPAPAAYLHLAAAAAAQPVVAAAKEHRGVAAPACLAVGAVCTGGAAWPGAAAFRPDVPAAQIHTARLSPPPAYRWRCRSDRLNLGLKEQRPGVNVMGGDGSSRTGPGRGGLSRPKPLLRAVDDVMPLCCWYVCRRKPSLCWVKVGDLKQRGLLQYRLLTRACRACRAQTTGALLGDGTWTCRDDVAASREREQYRLWQVHMLTTATAGVKRRPPHVCEVRGTAGQACCPFRAHHSPRKRVPYRALSTCNKRTATPHTQPREVGERQTARLQSKSRSSLRRNGPFLRPSPCALHGLPLRAAGERAGAW